VVAVGAAEAVASTPTSASSAQTRCFLISPLLLARFPRRTIASRASP
jgi:hypothetical protein